MEALAGKPAAELMEVKVLGFLINISYVFPISYMFAAFSSSSPFLIKLS